MSLIDSIVDAVTPRETDDARREAREQARGAATPGDWLSLVLEHHVEIERVGGMRPAYRPMSIARLGELLVGADEPRRWRLIAEFLEEYRWEPTAERCGLLDEEPSATGSERWDVFLAALAEHLAARDRRGAPAWTEVRSLRRLWFPYNTRAARVDALVNAPAAFRRRGIYVAAQELEVA